ncbi:MAG: DUF2523 family protein [Telluria sp.]
MFALFLPALVGALAAAIGSFVGRAILALGVGVVAYTGITLAVGVVKTNVITSVNALPSQALNLIGFLWFDKALTLVFSAVVASLAMKAIGGTVKKMVIK